MKLTVAAVSAYCYSFNCG